VAGEEPRAYVSVYPFVRSYQWCLLEGDRRRMPAEHGMMAREYPDVRANTAPCFALNDYEWILAFDADELHRLLELMRHLGGSEARLHTRVEIPFYTGHRKPSANSLPSRSDQPAHTRRGYGAPPLLFRVPTLLSMSTSSRSRRHACGGQSQQPCW
jgi:hypothetical protein